MTFQLLKPESKQASLSHHGLETFPQDNPDFARNSFNAGWNEIIQVSLTGFLEKELTTNH